MWFIYDHLGIYESVKIFLSRLCDAREACGDFVRMELYSLLCVNVQWGIYRVAFSNVHASSLVNEGITSFSFHFTRRIVVIGFRGIRLRLSVCKYILLVDTVSVPLRKWKYFVIIVNARKISNYRIVAFVNRFGIFSLTIFLSPAHSLVGEPALFVWCFSFVLIF